LFNSELGKLSTDWALEEAQLYKSKTKYHYTMSL